MKQVGKRILLTFILVCIFSLIFTLEVNAKTDKQRIYDFAEILTKSEVEELETIAQKYSDKRETDFIILTTPDSGKKDIKKFMQDFYDDEGLGYDKKHGNVAILSLDMKNRDVYLAGFYKAKERLDNARLTKIREKITPDLSAGNYSSAFESFIITGHKYMAFKPGVDPTNPLFNTWVQLAVAIGLGAVIVWSLARNVATKVTTHAGTYRDGERTKILSKRDRYIKTTVTKRRRPKQSSSGGGRGGGFSGGGRTSGGHSHSGSRGKF